MRCSVVVAIGVCICIAGCAANMQFYEGDPLPEDQVSYLSEHRLRRDPGEATQYGVAVAAIDGVKIGERLKDRALKKFCRRNEPAEIEAGHHVVSVTWIEGQRIWGKARTSGKSTIFVIRFDALPGHQYMVDGKIEGDIWTAWIEDTATGEIVATMK